MAPPRAAAVALLLCAAAVPSGEAWGAPGHMATAALAQRHLSGGAAQAAASDLTTFRELYPTESDFVTAADWCAARAFPPFPRAAARHVPA